jgi:hypothetical protein
MRAAAAVASATAFTKANDITRDRKYRIFL